MKPKPIKALCITTKQNPKLKALEICPINYLKELKIPKSECVWEVEIKAVNRISK